MNHSLSPSVPVGITSQVGSVLSILIHVELVEQCPALSHALIYTNDSLSFENGDVIYSVFS